MWLLELVLLVSACDYTLTAQPTDTELWSELASLAPFKSLFTLCLTGSDSTHRFILDNDSSDCAKGIPDLTIKYASHRSQCNENNN